MSRKPLLLGGPAFMPADKHASPARWLLRRDFFDFVGAGLPAKVGVKTVPLTGTHRQQAGFYSSSLGQLRAFNSMMRAARSKVSESARAGCALAAGWAAPARPCPHASTAGDDWDL